MSSEPLALDGHVLFVHDHRFISRQGQVFSEVQYDASHWSRYLQAFSQLTVVGREATLRPGLDAARLLLSSRDRVSFELLPSLSGVKAQLFFRAKVVRRLSKLVVSADYVVVRLPSELGLIAQAIARKHGIPCLIEVVDCAWDGLWRYGNWQGRVYAPLMAWRVRQAVRKAHWVQYVTRDFLQHRYPSCGEEQLSCSNVELDTPVADVLRRRLARIDRACTDQNFTLGLVGTLATRHKGVQTVLAALPALARWFPHLTFRVLGGGDPEPWRIEAERLGVSDRVHFDGVLPPGADVLSWLDGIDLYLHPSFKEGLPRALIEAMSRGCPAIATRVGGIPELLQEDCLIAPGDVPALLGLIGGILRSPERMRSQAQRNFHVASTYNRAVLQARRQEFMRRFRDSRNEWGGA
ncbi:glycosyltransferase family 4 protein [Stutzerimonas stutzeri]|uniref:glycosyltransferase family 4 protein n=1 Tax=Stutzerimonas stutzeri TaxID=316 RepID=UPI0012D71421|nr:glycosyltransferase family 4 protein [Stutzerimonas stutzeri]